MVRAVLGWTLSELAQRAVVGISTIQAVEAVDGPAIISGGGIAQTLEHRANARAATLKAIRKAFAGAGVTFVPDDGKTGLVSASNPWHPARNATMGSQSSVYHEGAAPAAPLNLAG
jgi:hypothetical protein